MLDLFNINPKNIHSEQLFQLVNELRRQCTTLRNIPDNSVDLVGTGGDGKNGLNFSTLASFIVAASGVPVIKHGSRSVSSKSGSFDCLDALNIIYPKTVTEAKQHISQYGLSFLCAPYFNPIFNEVSQIRKSLAKTQKITIFNLLGPLLNPAPVRRIVLGVYSRDLIPTMIETLQKMKFKRAIVCYGNGFDEFTITGDTHFALLENNQISYHRFSPQELGLQVASESNIRGGEPNTNAYLTTQILNGKKPGPMTDMALLNAAAGIFVGHDNLSLSDAFAVAKNALVNGKASALLMRLNSQDKILDKIVSHKTREARSLPDITNIPKNTLCFLDALQDNYLHVIAEIKFSSPSVGAIQTRVGAEAIAQCYQQAGASAISVLTDKHYFGGSFNDLQQVSHASTLPLLCKDIIVDTKQIIHACSAGAQACLLIVAALTDEKLFQFAHFIEKLGMTAVIEIHTEKELYRALKINPQVILINHRNLQNLTVDMQRSKQLAAKIPEGIKIIAASGITRAEDIQLLPKNIHAVLIGTALMKNKDPKKFIEECQQCAAK